MSKHTHVLEIASIGLRVFVKTPKPEFNWQEWFKKNPMIRVAIASSMREAMSDIGFRDHESGFPE